jgi:hypothetical protein
MSWARLDDGILDNAKIIAAGPLGFALHVAAITWCARNLTDGRIPKSRAHMLFPGDWQDTALHLCVCKLWNENGDSYQVHDFLEYNFSRATVEKRRAGTRLRMQKYRDARVTLSHAASDAHVTRLPGPVFSSPDVLPGISEKPVARVEGGPGETKRAAARRSPRVTWPDDFSLTDERRQVALVCGLDAAWEWNKFRDHARAHDARYANWDAAWRNWCRQAPDFAGRGQHGTR